MKIMRKQNGFTVIEGLLVLVIVGILAFTGWFIWHSKMAADKTDKQTVSDSQPPSGSSKSVSNYDNCIKANGSRTLESYPAVCVTKDGKHFTQDVNEGNKTPQYLVIKEWGVKMPLTSDTTDAYYTKSTDGMLHISTHILHLIASQISGCKPGVDDIYLQRSTDVSDAKSTWKAHIGIYYYFHPWLAEPQCISQDQDKFTTKYQTIQENLNKDVEQLTAE